MLHSHSQPQTKRNPTYRVSFALTDEDFGDAKVSDFDDHLMLVKENILSLEVSVQDKFVVDMV